MSENQREDEMEYELPNHPGKTIRRLAQSVRDQRVRLLVVLASVVCYTILSIIAPVYSAHIIDLLWDGIKKAMADGSRFLVTWSTGGREIIIYLLIYTAAAGFYTLQKFLMSSFAENLGLTLRTEIGEKLNRLPLSFFDQHKTGEILSRATNDMDKTAEAIQSGLLNLFTSVGMVIGSLLLMFRFHVGLTLIFLAFMGISALLTRWASAKTLKYAALRQQALSDVTGQIEESYSGRTIIRAFNQEAASSADMHEVNEKLAEATRKADFMMNAVNPAIRMVNRLGQVVLAILAGRLLINGTLTVGVFQAFFQYLNMASEPLTEAAYTVNSLQSALASVERIYRLLDEAEITPEPREQKVLQKARGMVEFQNVRFGYSPDKILMKDINFKAQPGQKIAIVGSTGAGKTTLINLLMRFYEVNGGRILLEGEDTQTFPRAELRRQFGMVLQDTWLFSGTIAENIAYGKPDAAREEIIAAAKAARVDFFVRTMPNGYDTVLTNDAENISVGQRQLLTIARVFLCNPPVLILDEATSSVDTRTEMEISKAMNRLMKNRTSFVIAHRLSTIVDADLILVMQQGDIIEQGTHAQLLEKNGAYASLYNSQFA